MGDWFWWVLIAEISFSFFDSFYAAFGVSCFVAFVEMDLEMEMLTEGEGGVEVAVINARELLSILVFVFVF